MLTPDALTTIDKILFANAGDARRVLLLDPSQDLLDAAYGAFESVAVCNDDVRSAEVTSDGDEVEVLLAGDALDSFDLALGRLPQNLNALDQIASELASAGVARYVASANTKHMTPRQNEVLEHSFASVQASLGQGKYRALIASEPTARMARAMDRYEDPTTDLVLLADGRVFAGADLDHGTALLLTTEGKWPDGDAVDVGCGNGVLTAVLLDRGNTVTGIDVSMAALRSTEATCEVNRLPEPDLLWADGLAALEDASMDLIVTNPPFHVGTTKDSSPTIAFLRDAPRVLRPGGELYCVFNAHLPYLQILDEVFDDVRIIARNADFQVARARKR